MFFFHWIVIHSNLWTNRKRKKTNEGKKGEEKHPNKMNKKRQQRRQHLPPHFPLRRKHIKWTNACTNNRVYLLSSRVDSIWAHGIGSYFIVETARIVSHCIGEGYTHSFDVIAKYVNARALARLWHEMFPSETCGAIPLWLFGYLALWLSGSACLSLYKLRILANVIHCMVARARKAFRDATQSQSRE